MSQLQITYLVSVNIITGDIHNSLLCCRKDHIAIANVSLNTRRIHLCISVYVFYSLYTEGYY